ncbi:unnamed protein product [Closterium sp. Naga37s-1]|nr:unnamed protein product [Closterium sp. Naga37s-1]
MADHLSPPWSHVCHVLQSLEQRRANCVVTVDDDSGATLTGSQLVADVACLARGLETFCGVAPGERVCIAALNSSAYVQWLLAVPAVGAILAPLNHRWCHPLSVSLPLSVTPSHCHSLSVSLPLSVTPSQCHFLPPLDSHHSPLPLALHNTDTYSRVCVISHLSSMQPPSISPFPASRNDPTERGRGSSSGAAGGVGGPGGGCTRAALVGPPHATTFSSPPFPFPTSPSHPLPSFFKPREQSIGEAAAAVQQVGATVLAVDAHMLPWWAHLKPLCPSLRLGVLISDQPIPSSASSPCELRRVHLMAACLLAASASSPSSPFPISSPSSAPSAPSLPGLSWAFLGFAAALSHTALISQSLAKLACAGYCHDDTFLHVAPLCHIGSISSLLAMLPLPPHYLPRVLPPSSPLPQAFLHVAPLCHIGGISSLLAMLTACARNVLVPRFLPSHLPHLFSRHRITALIAVPAMLTDLVSACSGERQGESTCARNVLVPHFLPAHLPRLLSFHRITALIAVPASSPFSSSPREESMRAAQIPVSHFVPTRANAAGGGRRIEPIAAAAHRGTLPMRAPHARLCQPSAHKSCPVVGEVLTRGPHVMSGYWGRPDETAAVLSPDGWLRTGDMGWIDFSGQIWLLGRRKEMIKSGGENVFCAEVEEAVRAHPGVVGAAAAGVPDERMGEAVAVLLVLKPGWVWSGISSNDSGGGDAGGAGGASDVGRFGSGGGSAARAAAAKNVSLSDLHAACQQHGLSSPRQHNQRQQQQQRRLVGVFTVRSSAVENAAAETNVTDEGKQLQQRKAEWARVRGVAERGAVVRGRVVSANAGGLMVRLGPLQAFLPLSQLDPSRLRGTAAVADVTRSLVGNMVVVRILELDEARTRLVVSEKRAAAAKGLPRVQQGRVYPGVVSSLTDFGAFVDLFQPEGDKEEGVREGEKDGEKEGAFLATGLVHVSELSWDPVRLPGDVVAVGDAVNALVLQVDRERERVGLSLKQVQADPLLETLDRLLPFQPAPDATSPSASALEMSSAAPSSPLPGAASPPALPGLLALCNQLQQQPGIVSVTLGRQAVERRVVSQDLELWLSNAPAAEGQFALLARAGRLVQEVQVVATLDREQMKEVLKQIS